MSGVRLPVREGWRRVQLGEVCEFRYGKSLPAGQRSGAGYPVYGSNGQVGRHDEALTAGPTIVVGRKGSFGEVCFSSGPSWPIDTAYYVEETSSKADLRWLFHLLGMLPLKDLNRAAAIPGLNREDAYDLTVLLPPIEEQRRIAAVLDAADALRAKRRQALAKLDTLPQAIFLEMFGEGSRSELARPLGDVADLVTGNTPPRRDPENYGGGIEWVKSDNISDSGAVSTAAERLSEQGERKGRTAPAGSTLIVCIAGSPSSIGRCGLLDRRAAFNQQITAATPHAEVSPEFLFHSLRASRRDIQRSSTSSMKGMVSKSALADVPVVVPDQAWQRTFEQRAVVARRCLVRATESSTKIDALFASLQQRAFRGEL